MIFMGVSMGWAIFPNGTLRKTLEETWALLEPGLRGPVAARERPPKEIEMTNTQSIRANRRNR